MSLRRIITVRATARYNKNLYEGLYGNEEESASTSLARRILYDLPEVVVMATTNPTKFDMYKPPLDGLETSKYAELFSLEGIQDLHSWLKKDYQGPLLTDVDEPYSTATENAMAKLLGYLRQVYRMFAQWDFGYPGLMFAVDDDFLITEEDFATPNNSVHNSYQPSGSIKNVEGKRTNDSLAIAGKYLEAVRVYGTQRNLQEFGLSERQKSLPVKFDYSLVAGVLVPKTDQVNKVATVEIVTHRLQVPGFLIDDETKFNEGYPVIWVPAVSGISGRSMGDCVKATRISDYSGLNLVIGKNLTRLVELIGNDDPSKWNSNGTIELNL